MTWADPFDPRDNILAGAAYLREIIPIWTPGFLAAYNAGPERYENHLATGRPFRQRPRTYVAILAPVMIAGKQVEGKIVAAADSLTLARSPLFVERLRPSLPTITHRPVCSQAVHQTFVLLSIYPLLCRSRATCLCTMPARPDRNDPDRASSQSVVGCRMF